MWIRMCECVDENAYKWMWVWDRALVKVAYVPWSWRIRSERNSKYGKFGIWMQVWDRALRKAAYVPLSQRIRSERSSKCGMCRWMCRLLVRRCKIVWLWSFCVVVQNIYKLIVWKWNMFFIGDDFKCLQQPKIFVDFLCWSEKCFHWECLWGNILWSHK